MSLAVMGSGSCKTCPLVMHGDMATYTECSAKGKGARASRTVGAMAREPPSATIGLCCLLCPSIPSGALPTHATPAASAHVHTRHAHHLSPPG